MRILVRACQWYQFPAIFHERCTFDDCVEPVLLFDGLFPSIHPFSSVYLGQKNKTKTQVPTPQPAPPVPEHQTIPRLADKYLSSMFRVYLGASSGTPHSGGIPVVWLNHLNWVLLMLRSSSSSLSRSQMTILTLSVREIPASLQRKTILCLQSFSCSNYSMHVTIGEHRDVDGPVNQQLHL